MSDLQTLEIPVKGMDCAECVLHVEHALAKLPGVDSVQVYLTAEKAVLRADPSQVTLPAIRKAVEGAGYSVPEIPNQLQPPSGNAAAKLADFTRPVLTLFGIVFGAVLFMIVFGEWLGLFEKITERVPWPIGLAIVLIGGYPIFRNVIRATLKRQVISHTLMSLGVLAALAVGQWATAAVVVFFMQVGDYAERFTTESARRAVKDLTAMAPQTARVEREAGVIEVPVAEARVGETVVVRPGEKIPVDGEVLSGQATVNQAAITGESMPVEVAAGSKVFAATLAQLGSLRVRITATGRDTTFGRVIQMVEEAEAHRADVQRIADKFSAYYLPVVTGIAALTFLLRRDPLATAAVLVVACSCSFALATPIAMLASIGAGAKRGLLIKGGKYLETLAQADVLLVDKTGTLTLGQPEITDIVPLDGLSKADLLTLAASAERYSEHPLAEAVREIAHRQGIRLLEPEIFKAFPGEGVSAKFGGNTIQVGSCRMLPEGTRFPQAELLEAQGKTVLWVIRDGQPAGLLAAADTIRPEVPQALAQVRKLGIRTIELLTGDNERTAAELAGPLGVSYRANLLPEQKIAIVKEYQAQGHIVVMVGDGVNDAPALAQADIGIAMGVAGSDVAVEAAHIALMREDWGLVPEVFRIAHRTMRVVKTNIAFTLVYNVIGLSLAAFGLLPPILAAAAQSLPDLGILGNSSRLIRQ
ncbi:MAG: cation-translocating P-type ATPase [Anaerolineaceae bacterium]|nr:cation-translocating P-type ATPase [Anaerolineaceae bacterium]